MTRTVTVEIITHNIVELYLEDGESVDEVATALLESGDFDIWDGDHEFRVINEEEVE